MAIRGKVIVVGKELAGNRKSDGQPWKKQEFVIETENEFHDKIAFSVMNDKFTMSMGETVEIEVNIRSREYNGKWYTECTAWKVNNLGFVAQPQNSKHVYQQTAPQGYTSTATPVNKFGEPVQTSAVPQKDDLPF